MKETTMLERLGIQIGSYRLVRKIGQGGFSEVYLGEHVYLRTQAAIKFLHMRLAEHDLQNFLIEARTIAHLIHPNIVRVMDFGIERGTPFLVMDYAPNGTLRQRYPPHTRLLPTDIVPYIKQIASALQYAHNQRLIHRDIKPENMLVGRNNEILLSDFGIALVAQSSLYQSTQDVVGTVGYMAPEQIQGKPRPASDQYSLGIVVYEWLSGARPFHGSFTELCAQHMFATPPPLHERIPTISPAIEQVVQIALAKNPHQRFAHIQDFARAFEQACQFQQPTGLSSIPGSQFSSAHYRQYPQQLSQLNQVPPFTSTPPVYTPSFSPQQTNATSLPSFPPRQFAGSSSFPPQQPGRPAPSYPSSTLAPNELFPTKQGMSNPAVPVGTGVVRSGVGPLAGVLVPLPPAAIPPFDRQNSLGTRVEGGGVGPYPLHHSHDAARLLTASVGSDALLPAGVLVPLPPAAIPPFDRQSSSGREAAGITAVKGRVWSIHISHIVAMIIGAILFGLLSHMIVYWHFNTSGSNFLNDGFAFPAIVISLFFGALFGPWVGAISGGLGAFIGDYILMFYPDLFANHSMLSNGIWHGSPLANVLVWIGFTSSSNTNWAWIVSNALMGFIAGLAMMGTRGRYVTLARVALAELMAAIGVLAGLGLLIVNKAWDPGLPYNNFIHFSTIDVLNIGFAHIILPTLALALTALSLLLPLTNALTHSREKST